MSILESRGSTPWHPGRPEPTLGAPSPRRIGRPDTLETGKEEGGSVALRVRELALAASRAALRADWNGGEREMEVRRTVRAACEVARAGGAQIEQLLILLKETWHELPDNRRRMDPATQATLARIVTICIREYYRPPSQS